MDNPLLQGYQIMQKKTGIVAYAAAAGEQTKPKLPTPVKLKDQKRGHTPAQKLGQGEPQHTKPGTGNFATYRTYSKSNKPWLTPFMSRSERDVSMVQSNTPASTVPRLGAGVVSAVPCPSSLLVQTVNLNQYKFPLSLTG